jgi:hypothetical protein
LHVGEMVDKVQPTVESKPKSFDRNQGLLELKITQTPSQT